MQQGVQFLADDRKQCGQWGQHRLLHYPCIPNVISMGNSRFEIFEIGNSEPTGILSAFDELPWSTLCKGSKVLFFLHSIRSQDGKQSRKGCLWAANESANEHSEGCYRGRYCEPEGPHTRDGTFILDISTTALIETSAYIVTQCRNALSPHTIESVRENQSIHVSQSDLTISVGCWQLTPPFASR